VKKVCKYCGKPEWKHHDFVAVMPPDCVCDPGEWGENIPKPCKKYKGDEGRCETCEHDKECHK